MGPHVIQFTPGSKVTNELELSSTDLSFQISYGSFYNTSLYEQLKCVYEGQGADTLGYHTNARCRNS